MLRFSHRPKRVLRHHGHQRRVHILYHSGKHIVSDSFKYYFLLSTGSLYYIVLSSDFFGEIAGWTQSGRLDGRDPERFHDDRVDHRDRFGSQTGRRDREHRKSQPRRRSIGIFQVRLSVINTNEWRHIGTSIRTTTCSMVAIDSMVVMATAVTQTTTVTIVIST